MADFGISFSAKKLNQYLEETKEGSTDSSAAKENSNNNKASFEAATMLPVFWSAPEAFRREFGNIGFIVTPYQQEWSRMEAIWKEFESLRGSRTATMIWKNRDSLRAATVVTRIILNSIGREGEKMKRKSVRD